MKTIESLPGSFRDPSGYVYQVEGRVFRTVMDHAAPDFDFVWSTGLFPELEQNGSLLPVEKVDPDVLGLEDMSVKYVLEAPKLPFISFPYEWPFPALKAAALLHLEIHLAALERGVTLSDASAYNVQFYGTRPVFIDHLSFRRYQNGQFWAGHRQFCQQFLNPLLLRALFGVSHNAWYRGSLEGIPAGDLCRLMKWRHLFSWNVLSHVMLPSYFQRTVQHNLAELNKETSRHLAFPLSTFRRMLRKLHSWISKLEPPDTGKTIWETYADSNNYLSQETELKRQFILDLVSQTRPQLLWDLGCNTGEYAKAALEGGAKYVVGFDSDHGALERGFARARAENLDFQPLFMDAANPSPSQGWRGLERQGLNARAQADVVLALAFVHHLVITCNIPFDQLLDWIVSLAPTGVIEFIPKSDPKVQELLQLREDIFPDYTESVFLARVARRAKVVKTKTVSSSGRLLLWYATR